MCLMYCWKTKAYCYKILPQKQKKIIKNVGSKFFKRKPILSYKTYIYNSRTKCLWTLLSNENQILLKHFLISLRLFLPTLKFLRVIKIKTRENSNISFWNIIKYHKKQTALS